jgi:hypothetical protein
MVIKTSQLMMNTAKDAFCSDIHTKHTKQSKHHIEFYVKPAGGVKKLLSFERLSMWV